MEEVEVTVKFSSSEMKRIVQNCTILNYFNYEQKQHFLEGYIHGLLIRYLSDIETK